MTTRSVDADPVEPTRAELLAELVALRGRLVTLPAIEQAKGALMATYGLTADEAFDVLRFHSQTGNVKIRAIAAHLTTLMATAPTDADAIARFDTLLSRAVRHLDAGSVDRESIPSATTVQDRDLPEVTVRAVAAAPPGITIADNGPDQPLVYANHAFADLTGYPIGEVLGRNCRFLQGAATDPGDTAVLSRALHAGRDAVVVLKNYRSDGSPFWNEVAISPIRNPLNQITHFIGTQTDVTARVSAPAGRATG